MEYSTKPATLDEAKAAHFTGIIEKVWSGTVSQPHPPQVEFWLCIAGKFVKAFETRARAAAFLEYVMSPVVPPEPAPVATPVLQEFAIPKATTRDKWQPGPQAKRAHAEARKHGLDSNAPKSLVTAFNRFYGTSYASRSEIPEHDESNADWEHFADEIARGTWRLAWKQVFFRERKAVMA
jgi:hypothetical protein